MIDNKYELNEWLSTERKALLGDNSVKKHTWLYLTQDHWYAILKYQKFLRYELYHRNKNTNLYHRIMEILYCRKKNKLGNKLGFYIGCEVFDKGLTIYHHGGVIVNGYARVGKNCRLHGQNCIGNNGKDINAPRIGNNVDIGVGAKIIGDVVIADDITIGAGSVVVDSFLEKGITIAGVPARKIK